MYYSLKFTYRGPKNGTDSLSASSCHRALEDVEKALKWLSFMPYAIQYAWPDGSLYFFVKTDLTKDEAKLHIETAVKATAPRFVFSNAVIRSPQVALETVEEISDRPKVAYPS